MKPEPCLVCGAQVYAKARCRSCYVFLRRHGRDRTHEEAVANAVHHWELGVYRRRTLGRNNTLETT